ncbi:hypothetical protein HNQ77_002672 [Silvibacterium bohemicum]|uniref:Uncharacterized protein n=1 Tax=Silvibacterium bohemicum TaxID=1577686 RepID=A0A841JTQ4_9BACT|nr:hypothetical protein [Silvibacterium bohemicum]MBB6144716.1 hypothetical protein [Silvibacterium bohemicum]
MPKRKVADTPADPTLPTFPIQIDGTTYTLCLDFAALAEAESALQRAGHDVCILRHMPSLSFELVKAFFVCGVQRFHPDLAFEDASKLVRLDTVWLIAKCIDIAYAMAMPATDEKPGEAQPGE